METSALILPAFIAGILMFLAPCTLPLVPAFLGFIGGASDVDADDPKAVRAMRRRVITNGALYAFGFTVIFVLLGTAVGSVGGALAAHRGVLSRIGGAFVLLLGLYMMRVFRPKALRFLDHERRLHPSRLLRPGRPISSFLFGATFALGWSPCVGPILGSVLLLATSSGTAAEGALLLTVFSLGMALPFLALAVGYGHAAAATSVITRHMDRISVVGGAFLVFLGVLMVTDHMEIWLQFAYRMFAFIDYDRLLQFL